MLKSKEEILAEKWIKEMKECGLTLEQMLDVLKLAKKKYKRLKK